MLSAPLLSEDFDQFLQQEMGKELLRFTTAGSVDDGKSTLIGRQPASTNISTPPGKRAASTVRPDRTTSRY
jgi:hypothetical protein